MTTCTCGETQEPLICLHTSFHRMEIVLPSERGGLSQGETSDYISWRIYVVIVKRQQSLAGFQGDHKTPVVPPFLLLLVMQAAWRGNVICGGEARVACMWVDRYFPSNLGNLRFYTVTEQMDPWLMLYNLCSWFHIIFTVGSCLWQL